MKIQTGSYRHMPLTTPDHPTMRPTSAIVREALMNILAPYCEDSVFIDLFAGSCSVGFEALSRGARGCIFVDSAKVAEKTFRKNLKDFATKKQDLVTNHSPLAFLNLDLFRSWTPIAKIAVGDIIWADPPYSDCKIWLEKCSRHLSGISKTGSLFIMECLTKEAKDMVIKEKEWNLIKDRRYGDTTLLIWERMEVKSGEEGTASAVVE